MLGSTCMCHHVLMAHQSPLSRLKSAPGQGCIFQISFGSTSSPALLCPAQSQLPSVCNFYHLQLQDRLSMLLQVKSLETPQCLSPQLVALVTVKLSLFLVLRLRLPSSFSLSLSSV